MLRLTLYEVVKEQKIFGPERARTADLLLAKQALYQLSYRPENAVAKKMVGQRGIAPLTPALSALCSTN